MRRHRLSRGITVNELAQKAGCSSSYLRALEQGEEEHSGEFVMRLGAALRLSAQEMGELLGCGGYLPEPQHDPHRSHAVMEAIAGDSRLDRDGRRVLSDMYDFLAERGAVVASGEGQPVEHQQPISSRENEAQMKGSDPAPPVLYSVDDVAQVLMVCTKTVRRMIAEGRLGHVRLGRLVRVTEEQLHEYVATVARPSTVVGIRPSNPPYAWSASRSRRRTSGS